MSDGPIVLVGLMGAGKTSVGRPLADRLGRPYVDSDEVLEEITGRTAQEIQSRSGRAGLHGLERQALASVAGEPLVFGAAASVVDEAEGRAMLHDATVIYLRADPAALVERAMAGTHRPLPEQRERVEEMLRRQHQERDPAFAACASLTLDVGERTIADLVEAIATHLT